MQNRYLSPEEIKLLDKKECSKLFRYIRKRLPISDEIEHMQKTGEIKIIPLTYKNKPLTEEQKAEKLIQKEKNLAYKKAYNLKLKEARKTIRKHFTLPNFTREARSKVTYTPRVTKSELKSIMEVQIIKSNNEKRKELVLEYHERNKTKPEITKQMLQIINKY